jgi:hypothetical protein
MRTRHEIVSVLVFVAMLAIGFGPGNALADQAGWIVQFGTEKGDSASGVAVDGKDIYVSGGTQGALGGPNAGGQDLYVRKYNTRGELQWTRQFGTPENDQTAIGGLDARHGLVVIGGGVRAALPGQAWTGLQDAFVRAYDRNGNLLWTRQFGSPVDERVRHVAMAKDGSIFVSGQTRGGLMGQPNLGSTDAFVLRLDPDGTVRWLRQFGTSGIDEAIGVAVIKDAVYVTGVTTGVFPGQASAGGDFDSFVARLTLDGDIEWITQFGTPGSDGAWKIGVAGPTIFVSGNTDGQFPGETKVGGNDGFVAAFGHDGALRWARQFGTAGNENAPGLAVDHEGAVAVGRFGGMSDLGTNDPASDAFARKYDADGNLLWMLQFGTPVFDHAQDVAVKGNDVYIVGNTQGSLPGNVSAGLGDAWLMRIRMDNNDRDDGDEEDDEDEN